MDDILNVIDPPKDWVVSDEIIKVLGVGGGGCNAVNTMYNKHIEGCTFAVCNTDSMALHHSPVPTKIQMGKGLGAGTDPIKGRDAAIESMDMIDKLVLGESTQMLFITAGMGGGTGTGATPVIAKAAKDKGILTVAVVTLPFKNEGDEAHSRAIEGIHELEKNVDSLLVINNEKLYEYFGDLLVHDAFPKADEVLCTAVRGIIEIIKKPGHINVDFQDVQTMMRNSGMALMGCGSGSGENRIDDAIKEAFESPLLNDFDLKTAKNVLINITSGKNEKGLKMQQLSEINRKISEYTGGARNFKHGLVWDDDPNVGDTIHITAIATGFKIGAFIEPDMKNDKIILITRDFVYDRQALSSAEGIELSEECNTNIGYSSKEGERTFKYDPDVKPALIVEDGADISRLEDTPAIRRKI